MYEPSIYLEELRKTKKPLSITGLPAEVRTQYLRNMRLDCYRYASLFGGSLSITNESEEAAASIFRVEVKCPEHGPPFSYVRAIIFHA
jgi:hypothetical protein